MESLNTIIENKTCFAVNCSKCLLEHECRDARDARSRGENIHLDIELIVKMAKNKKQKLELKKQLSLL